MGIKNRKIIALLLLFIMIINNLTPLQVLATEEVFEETHAEEVQIQEPALEEAPVEEPVIQEPVVEEVKEEPVVTTEPVQEPDPIIESEEPQPVVESNEEEVNKDESTVIEEPKEEENPVDEENVNGKELEEEDKTIEETSNLMPEKDFEATTRNIHVKVHANENTFYEGTYMRVEPVETLDIIDSLEETIDNSVASVLAVNITFYNKDNEVVEPLNPVNVSITSDEIIKMDESVVVHVDDKGEAALVNKENETNNNVSFNADSFSIYAIVGTETISTLYNASNGNTYEVTVTYGPEAKIPYGSTLKVTEYQKDTENYNKALNAVYADLINKGEKIDLDTYNLAALDISILDINGNEIEPASAVNVNLKIKSLPDVDNLNEVKDSIEIQHHVETENGVVIEHVNYQENLNNNNLNTLFNVKTNQEIINNGTVVNPNNVNIEDLVISESKTQNEYIETSFSTEEFSTFTISWGNSSSTIHYGYMENNRFVEFSSNPTNTINNSNREYLIRDFDGYVYSGAYYSSSTTNNPTSATHIEPLLYNLYSSWRYHNYNNNHNVDNNWNTLGNGSHVYVVYNKRPTIPTGGTPVVTITDDTVKPNPPTILKESKSNDVDGHNDGTRTISLSITGNTTKLEADKLADVIVVFDISGSMDDYLGSRSRLDTAKSAVNSLAQSLLSQNTNDKELIRMALVSFNHTVDVPQGFTTNYSTFSSAVNRLQADGGTNWEGALYTANQMAVESDRATFIIFVSDGDPTYRISRYDTENNTIAGYSKDSRYLNYNVFGNGTADPGNKNFDAAVDEAKLIVQNNKNFYTIGISNDVTKMASLNSQAGGKGNFTATNSPELTSAFDKIKKEIEGTLGYGGNTIDGITGLTNLTAKASVSGVDTGTFVYYKAPAPANWNQMTAEQKKAYIPPESAFVEWNPSTEGAKNATYNETSGAVEWDLGTNFQLEDGVTYKVSFLVWPSQTAMDYLTQINNGDITYDELPADVRAQIKETPAGSGKYILKTNTEQAYVEYQMCSKVGDTITPIGDTTKEYFKEVEPLTLDSMELTIEKVFNDLLTAGEDREKNVNLYLERRNLSLGDDAPWEPYEVTYTYENGTKVHSNIITLGNVNNTELGWKAHFYVSPGLETIHGTETIVYNPGYEYRLTEPSIDYHYELNGETIKPMLVNNEKQYLGDTNKDSKLTAENIVKGGINIEKVVVDYDKNGKEFEVTNTDDTEFTIKGYIVDEKGQPYTFDPAWDDRTDKSTGVGASATWQAHQNDTGAYHHYDKDGNRIGYKLHFASTANIELKLKAGESVRFVNVPQNATYEFHEEQIPANYESNYIIEGENATRLVANGPLVTEGVTQPDVTSTSVSGTVYGNVQHNVVVKNIAKSSNLEISKTVEGIDTNQEFTFTIKLSDTSINKTYNTTGVDRYTSLTFTNGQATVSLKNGETIKILELPKNINYTVTETEVDSFVTNYINENNSRVEGNEITGQLVGGSTSNASFVNIYNSTGTLDLEVSKVLTGKTLENGQFTFILKEGDKQLQSKTNNGAGKVIFDTITYNYNDIGNGTKTYTISEVNPGNTPGYTYDSTPITVTVTLTDDGQGHITATPVYSKTTFNNKYEATGSITFGGNKTLEGRSLTSADVFEFEVIENGKTIATAKNDGTGTITYPTINYDQDDIGTHIYTIKEKSTNIASVNIDTKTYTVTVVVEDNGNGTLKVTSTDAYTALNFVNTYASSGSINLEVNKSLTGKNLENGQFTFQLKDKDGNIKQTKTNDAQGKVTFDAITYTQADVPNSPITYTIHEVVPESAPGYTYDTTDSTVTVTLTDNNQGTITATAEYSKTTFNNKYEATGEITFEGTKTLTGRDLTANDTFTFEIFKDNVSVETVTNDSTGKINFPKISYTQADIGKTYTYKIKEKSTSTNTITVDNTEYTVTVSITDNGDGTLNVTTRDNYQHLDFVNTYNSNGKVQLEVTKSLTGKTLENEQFTFELTGNGTTLTAKNDANGRVLFSEITYTQADVAKSPIKYTIHEVKPENTPGYTYDSTDCEVTVTLTDDGNGKITATPSYTKTKFENKYEAKGDITFEGIKTLEGRDLTANDVFNFEITEGNTVVGSGQNDSTGKITFTKIEYDQDDVGSHTYTIKETSQDGNNIKVDTKIYTVTVTVSDNGNGTLKVEPNGPYKELNFINKYSSSGAIILEVKKSLDGRKLENEQFTFELKNEAGEVLQTKKNDANGKVVFDEIKYNQADIKNSPIKYTIHEVNPGNTPGYTYDLTDITVEVKLEDDGQGNITAKAEYSKSAFSNKYEASGEITFEGTKTLTGRDLTANDVFNFEITERNTVVGSGQNDSTGKITFTKIEYDQDDVGNHTYTIKETSRSTNTITVDPRTYTVNVTVKDNGNGTLTATSVDNYQHLDFENKYSSNGSIDLQVTKSLEGRKLEANQFTFELKNEAGEVLQTKKNSSNGEVKFDTINYTQENVKNSPIKYTISEKKENKAGYTYDEVVSNVSVTLADDGQGHITATPSYSKTTFNNKYEATGSITFGGNKTLEGRSLTSADVFEFEVIENGKTIATASNNGTGTITYPTINYDQDDIGTHIYTIKEKSTNIASVSIDTKTYTVTVVVEDNGNGTLKVTSTDSYTALDFVNTYKSNGSVELEVTKSLEGRKLEADQFTFELKNEAGEVLQTKKNTSNGEVIFDTINYTQENVKNSPIKYTISEKKENKAGYTYDEVVSNVSVALTDNGQGTITATPTYSKTKFENKYHAEGSITFNGTKTLTGRALTSNDIFEFEIIENGTVVAKANNDANGKITYPTINYTEKDVKTHNYIVKESSKNTNTITVDTNTYTVTVVVEDNGDGTLKVTSSDAYTALDFVNAYKSSGKIQLEITKELTGRTLENEQFTFELTGNDTTLTAKNDANGKVLFDEITYTQADVPNSPITYTITEIDDDKPGYTYDTTPITVEVALTDNGQGKITAVPTYSQTKVTNKYEATGEATITVTKVLEGKELEEGQFTFELINSEGEVIQETTNAADGSVTFEPITFDQTQVDSFTYMITEVNDEEPGYIYDDLVAYAYIEVIDIGNGTLDCKVTYGDDTEFNNEYETIDITVNKVWDDFDNKYNYRLDSIKVTLLADGDEIETATLSKDTKWTYTWEDMDKYSSDGEIKYTVQEEKYFAYTPSYSGDAENGFTITNKLNSFGGGDEPLPPPPTIIVINPHTRSNDNMVMYTTLAIISLVTMAVITVQEVRRNKRIDNFNKSNKNIIIK